MFNYNVLRPFLLQPFHVITDLTCTSRPHHIIFHVLSIWIYPSFPYNPLIISYVLFPYIYNPLVASYPSLHTIPLRHCSWDWHAGTNVNAPIFDVPPPQQYNIMYVLSSENGDRVRHRGFMKDVVISTLLAVSSSDLFVVVIDDGSLFLKGIKQASFCSHLSNHG